MSNAIPLGILDLNLFLIRIYTKLGQISLDSAIIYYTGLTKLIWIWPHSDV